MPNTEVVQKTFDVEYVSTSSGSLNANTGVGDILYAHLMPVHICRAVHNS